MKARNRALAAEIAAAPRIWLALRLLIVYSVLLCLWAAGPFWLPLFGQHRQAGDPVLAFLVKLPLAVIELGILSAIYSGIQGHRRWSRVTLAILVSGGLAVYVAQAVSSRFEGQSALDVVLAIAGYVSLVAATVLLFTAGGAKWFCSVAEKPDAPKGFFEVGCPACGTMIAVFPDDPAKMNCNCGARLLVNVDSHTATISDSCAPPT